MKLSRDKIQRMVKTNGIQTVGRTGGSGAGGGGGVSATWVDDNYISKAFFTKLFQAYNGSTLVEPNDTESTINNIKAMFGFWTEQYISALGQNSGGGGGGGGATALADLTDVILNSPETGEVLKYNGSHWVNASVGSVTRVETGTGLDGGPITSSGTIRISDTYVNYISNGVTAYGWGDHSTQGYLKGITAAMINNALGFTLSGTAGSTYNLSSITSNILTLQGYFDTNGNAKNALRLTTTSKTAWGQTFWTSGGVPTSISGSLSGVGDIIMTGSINGARSIELSGYNDTDGGFIDFHYNGSSGDYTSRIIEDSLGRLQFVAENGIRIGNGVIKWDSTNNAIRIERYDGSSANFYATGGVSALGLSSGGIGNIDNLTVDSYLYIKTTDNYLHINLSTLQIKSGGTITLNDNCTVNAAGNTLTVANVSGTNISGTNLSVNKETIGTSLTAATIEIYHNGTKYYFNKAAAVSAGILTTSNG